MCQAMLIHYFSISGDLWRHGFFKCSPVLTGSEMSTCYSSLEAAHSKDQFHQQPPSYTCLLSRFRHVWLFKTPWSVAGLAPLCMGVCKQAYWSGLPCPPPGDPPDPGIHPTSLTGIFTNSATWEAYEMLRFSQSVPLTLTTVLQS